MTRAWTKACKAWDPEVLVGLRRPWPCDSDPLRRDADERRGLAGRRADGASGAAWGCSPGPWRGRRHKRMRQGRRCRRASRRPGRRGRGALLPRPRLPQRAGEAPQRGGFRSGRRIETTPAWPNGCRRGALRLATDARSRSPQPSPSPPPCPGREPRALRDRRPSRAPFGSASPRPPLSSRTSARSRGRRSVTASLVARSLSRRASRTAARAAAFPRTAARPAKRSGTRSPPAPVADEMGGRLPGPLVTSVGRLARSTASAARVRWARSSILRRRPRLDALAPPDGTPHGASARGRSSAAMDDPVLHGARRPRRRAAGAQGRRAPAA